MRTFDTMGDGSFELRFRLWLKDCGGDGGGARAHKWMGVVCAYAAEIPKQTSREPSPAPTCVPMVVSVGGVIAEMVTAAENTAKRWYQTHTGRLARPEERIPAFDPRLTRTEFHKVGHLGCVMYDKLLSRFWG